MKGKIESCEYVWCKFNVDNNCESEKVEIAAGGQCWTAKDIESEF